MSTKRPIGYGGSEELEKQIEKLVKAFYDINCCHGCVVNCESSGEMISLLNDSADMVKMNDKDIWWKYYNDNA